MKEIMKTKRVKALLLSLIGILVCSTGIVTLAVLLSKTDQLENTFQLGNITTEIEEEFEETDVPTTFTKTPAVINTGANDCLVRVRVTVSPEEQLDVSGWDLQNWTQKGEYYYYNGVLKSGEKTTPLFTTVSVKEEYVDTIEGFEVNVYQEAVQTKMNAMDGSSTTDPDRIWAAYEANEIPESFK